MAAASELPWQDEASWKEYDNAGKNPAEPIPVLGEMPLDGVLPGADPAEKAGIAEIRKHLTEANNAAADDWLVSRFYRGYTVRSWAHAPDRIERTAQLVNFTCDQRRLWKHDELRKKTLPRTDEWYEQWPQSYPGNDGEGRCIWYMLLPQDFMKAFSQPDAQEHHIQDMLRLEKIKRNNNEALKAAGRTERSHHVLVCDISHEKGVLSRAAIKGIKSLTAHTSGCSVTQHTFPDVLERALVINASLMFRSLWAVGRMFMDAETAKKYTVCGGSWQAELEKVGVPLRAVAMVSGGTGLNPPGLSCKLSVSAPVEATLDVPEHVCGVKWSLELARGNPIEVKVVAFVGSTATVVHDSTLEEGAKSTAAGEYKFEGGAGDAARKVIISMVSTQRGTFSRASSAAYTLDAIYTRNLWDDLSAAAAADGGDEAASS